MASFSVNGLDEYAFSMEELASIPDSVINDMLSAEKEIIKEGQIREAKSMLQGPYYEGGVAGAVTAGSMKTSETGRYCYITFNGTQHGNRVAEIAFINEFGKHNQPARPFISQANEKNASAAVDAAEAVYDKYLKSKGL